MGGARQHPYSAVTQPSPLPRRNCGTRSSTLAVHSTRVSPNAASTGALGVARVAALEPDRAELVGLAAAGAGEVGPGGDWSATRWCGVARELTIRDPPGRSAAMIRSMTAFASAEAQQPWGQFACELRSVNHRYLEVAVRLPEEFRSLEPKLRDAVAQRMSRGKLDLALRMKREAGSNVNLKLNVPLARELFRIARELGTHAPDLAPGTRLEALGWPGMIVEPDADAQDSSRPGSRCSSACSPISSRRASAKASACSCSCASASTASSAPCPRCAAGCRRSAPRRRPARREAGRDPAAGRSPAASSRSSSGPVQARRGRGARPAHRPRGRGARDPDSAEPAGRRLDFMLQEFNREANTLGSKSVDQRTTRASSSSRS
jgi:hypothetical protein